MRTYWGQGNCDSLQGKVVHKKTKVNFLGVIFLNSPFTLLVMRESNDKEGL